MAFAVHAYLLAHGYKLVATGAAAEDAAAGAPLPPLPPPAPRRAALTPAPRAPADFVSDLEEVDAAGWDSMEGAYAFRYQDTEGELCAAAQQPRPPAQSPRLLTPAPPLPASGRRPPLRLRCVAVAASLLVQWAAGAAQDAPSSSLELDTRHFATDEAGVPQGYRNTEELVKKLDHHLGPALAAPGAGAEAQGARAGEAAQRPGAGRPAWAEDGEPLREGPARGGGGALPPGILPTGVGYEDVVPPGFHPPGFGAAGRGGGGGVPLPGEGPPHPGGGMHVGPGHPMFGPGRLGGGVGMPPDPGLGGLPPGARWDPVGPPGTPGWRPGDFRPAPPRPPHPDIMQPGPGRGTDWDAFFG